MTSKEIEQYRQEIRNILEMDVQKAHKESKLKDLSSKVGASTVSHRGNYNAEEPELVDNLNDALRTEAMILACKTAGRNSIIAIIAAIVSVASMLAAWAAVLFGYRWFGNGG